MCLSFNLNPHWSCKPPVTLTIIGVPDIKLSQVPNPNPSLDAKLIVTSAMLYNLFNSSDDSLLVEKIIFKSGHSSLHTAGKSVPFPSIGCVCRTNATLSLCSFGSLYANSLNAIIVSDVIFLLILRLLYNIQN